MSLSKLRGLLLLTILSERNNIGLMVIVPGKSTIIKIDKVESREAERRRRVA